MQVIEDNPKYWEVISSALAVGWLDIVVSQVLFSPSFSYLYSLVFINLLCCALHFMVPKD